MVEKILNNTTPYGKFRASHEGSLHSSTLIDEIVIFCYGENDYNMSIFEISVCILPLGPASAPQAPG